MFLVLFSLVFFKTARHFSEAGSSFRFHNLTLSPHFSISSPYFKSPLLLGIPTFSYQQITLRNAHFSRLFNSVLFGHFNRYSINIYDSSFRQILSPIRVLYDSAQESFKDRVADRVSYENTSISISNTLFETLQSNSKGGAFFASNCQADFSFCLFTENHAPYGASIAIEKCHTSFLLSNFSHNYAEVNGGVLFADANCEVSFQKCTIRDCKSEDSAGAIYAKKTSLFLTKCVFYRNYAESRGGALNLHNSRLKASSCSFMNNVCTISNSGSVLVATNSTASFLSCSLDQNMAGLAGDQKIPILIVGPYLSRVSFSDSCLSSSSSMLMENISFDEKTQFPSTCPREDPSIPEIQEEFHVCFEVNSAIKSKGFIITILILIIVPVVVVLSLPFLVMGTD